MSETKGQARRRIDSDPKICDKDSVPVVSPASSSMSSVSSCGSSAGAKTKAHGHAPKRTRVVSPQTIWYISSLIALTGIFYYVHVIAPGAGPMAGHDAVGTSVGTSHVISCGGRGVLDTPIANASLSYDDKLEWIRRTQFPHLNKQVYLDYTGAGLYQIQQVEQLVCDLKSNLYGNAHSQSPSSLHTEQTLCDIRHKVLDFFNASPSEYSVIFTSGCTGT